MPTLTIPLVGSETRRGLAQSASTTKDQFFAGCTIVKIPDEATKSMTVYVEKRPALNSGSVASAGDIGTAIFPSPSLSTPSVATTVLAFGATNSKIWAGGDRGTITGVCYFITETIIGGVTFWLLSSSNGTGWYLASDSYAATAYTADGNNSTTISDIKISGANSTAGLYSGQLLAAASNIVAGTRIVSVDASAFTAVLDTATTGGAFNDLAITKTPVAKIIDADFPSMVGGFAVMDGFAFVMTATGRVYNSDVNSITSWQSSSFITANMSTDTGLGVITYKNHIVAFGNIRA